MRCGNTIERPVRPSSGGYLATSAPYTSRSSIQAIMTSGYFARFRRVISLIIASLKIFSGRTGRS